MYYDDLYAPLGDMEEWQVTAFAAAVTERIFPHFALYDQLLENHNVGVARTALDKIWDKLAARGSCNTETQMAKIEGIVHDEEDASFGASLAFDSLVAIMATIHCLESASIADASGVAHLAREAIAKYLEMHVDDTMDDDELVRHIATHELMEQELAFHVELMKKLMAMPTPKATELDVIKSLGQANGVSNIGISVDK
jgi:uncharacterized protein YjaG (DUF416 family)